MDEQKRAWVARKLRFSKFNDAQLNIYVLYASTAILLDILLQSKDELATSLASLGNYLSGSLYLHSYQMAWVRG